MSDLDRDTIVVHGGARGADMLAGIADRSFGARVMYGEILALRLGTPPPAPGGLLDDCTDEL